MGMVFGKVGEEQPSYNISLQNSDYQIRKYAPYAVAEVRENFEGSDEQFHGQSFRMLAKYIGVFGDPNNVKRQPMAMTAPVISGGSGEGEKMAMTAPVISGGGGSGRYFSFVLPSAYTAESAPAPLDSRITLRQIGERTLAVHTFSGTATPDVAEEKARWLIARLTKDGYSLEVKGGSPTWELARYNPPFTIPMFRTNEIHVPVAHGPGV